MNNFKVLICTYNPNAYLIEQVDSIINNGISDILISDDSDTSDTGTVYFLEKILAYKSSKIQIIEGVNKGNASANFLNTICSLDESVEWLFISDQDDVWLPNKVDIYKESISKLDAHSEPIAICSDAIVVDKDKKIISTSLQSMINRKKDILLTDDILFSNCVQGATLCLNKSMISEIKNLKEIIDFNHLEKMCMYDWFIAILAKYKGKCIYLDVQTIYYRIHGMNQVGAKNKFIRYFIYVIKPWLIFKGFKLVMIRYEFINDLLYSQNINLDGRLKLKKSSSVIKKLAYNIFIFFKKARLY